MRKRVTQVIRAHSVAEIDFNALREQGIDCVLFDIEGTIAPWGTTEVSLELRKYIADSGITKIGIVTNLNKRHVGRARGFGVQIGAGSVQVPLSMGARKPGPQMIIACMSELNSEPSKTVMIGDKLLDVLAAKNAQVAKAIWVDYLPGPDHWFDRYVYRKVEPLLKKILA